MFSNSTPVCAVEAWKFNFDSQNTVDGYTTASATNIFSEKSAWGFDFGFTVTNAADGGVTSSRPFYFSVAVPEGNYYVTAKFGDKGNATTNTVKAEARRLMVENVRTGPGEMV